MNADVGFMETATLHQRQGDLNVQTSEEGHTWGRFLAQDLNAKGRDRFSYEQETTGVQFGHDVRNSTDDQGTRTRIGVLAHYANSKTDAWDHLRPGAGLQADTGEVATDSYGFGAYRTDMKADGSYTDWIGHINQIKNGFADSYGGRAEQKGVQLALGVEKGIPLSHFTAAEHEWTVEGQAQAVLLHTHYSAFEDQFSRMTGQSFDALRGRVGVRIHNGQVQPPAAASVTSGQKPAQKTQVYGLVHLVHDLIKTDQMALQSLQGSDSVEVGEKFDQTYLEVGVGVQTQVGEAQWMWADARYEAGLQNRKNTGKLSIGFKKSF